jgi:hypothetical protein
MKKYFKTIGIFTLSIFAFSACKRAGTNGDATLVVFPQHHGRTIPNHAGYPDSVYVKFNAKDLPENPTQNFDVVFVGEVGEDHVHCEGLHTGNYFLYATGWDTTINERVTGGESVKIRYKDRKQEIDVNVPVTE